jgi:hypothetical protein
MIKIHITILTGDCGVKQRWSPLQVVLVRDGDALASSAGVVIRRGRRSVRDELVED